jgi:hypothetical protein
MVAVAIIQKRDIVIIFRSIRQVDRRHLGGVCRSFFGLLHDSLRSVRPSTNPFESKKQMRNSDIPNHIIRRALVSGKTILGNPSQPARLIFRVVVERSWFLSDTEASGMSASKRFNGHTVVAAGVNDDEWPDIL